MPITGTLVIWCSLLKGGMGYSESWPRGMRRRSPLVSDWMGKAQWQLPRQTKVHTHIHSYSHPHVCTHIHTLPYTPMYRDSDIQTHRTTKAETSMSHQSMQSAKFKEVPLLGSLKDRISPESKCPLKFYTLGSWLSSPWSTVYDTHTYPVIRTLLHTWMASTHTHTCMHTRLTLSYT